MVVRHIPLLMVAVAVVRVLSEQTQQHQQVATVATVQPRQSQELLSPTLVAVVLVLMAVEQHRVAVVLAEAVMLVHQQAQPLHQRTELSTSVAVAVVLVHITTTLVMVVQELSF